MSFTEMVAGARFAARLPAFLRRPLTVGEARAIARVNRRAGLPGVGEGTFPAYPGRYSMMCKPPPYRSVM